MPSRNKYIVIDIELVGEIWELNEVIQFGLLCGIGTFFVGKWYFSESFGVVGLDGLPFREGEGVFGWGQHINC